MKIILLLILGMISQQTAYLQTCTINLTGHVEDADTKDKLQASTVVLKELNQQLITDEKGDFTFTQLCPGNYTIVISHIGCDTFVKKISLSKDYHVDVLLPHNRKLLGAVIVDAQKSLNNSGFKKELSGKALEETKGLSLAEALSKINGVTMLQTGSTIAKPVIHGLHSNRILTINNGVRQEGQQWGNEHAPEIDPFIADKLTVIKGVDELKYGSDAIGGVIIVEPKALLNKPGKKATINSAYFTNNKQYVISAMFEAQLKKIPALSYRFQGTYKSGANATTPNYRLNNTASNEKNFSITIGYRKNLLNTELFYSHFATKLGIFIGSHIGNLTDLQTAIAAPKPNADFIGENTYAIKRPNQQVTHHLLKSKTTLFVNEHKFTLLLAGQFNHRQEFDIVRNTSNKKPQLDLSIYTLSQDISWEHPKKNNFSGTAGISLMQQNNTYTGRYFIPNYFSYTLGGYYIEKWMKHQWELQAGIRYDNKTINTTRLKFNGDTLNYGFNFSTLATSFNAIFKPTTHWKLNANIGISNRAPYVNELLSDGIHQGTATYEKGDITLQPEQSINVSIGSFYQHPSKTFSVDVLIYTNSINNFVYQQPRPDNPVLTIAGAFPLIEYKQTNAVLKGVDISTLVKPIPALEWTTKISYLHAFNTSLNDWLILMPANRLSNEISYTIKDGKKITGAYISAEMTNVLQQKNVPSDKNGRQDYKQPPPAYSLISLHAAATIKIFKKPVKTIIGVRNLLNTVYRDYLNSMRYFSDDMGRNISVQINIQL